MTYELRKPKSFGLVLKTSSKAKADKAYAKLRPTGVQQYIIRSK